MGLSDGLPDYELMMSRSLALWQNFFEEMRGDPSLSVREALKVQSIIVCIQSFRAILPPDPGFQPTSNLFRELDKELEFLHKRLIHALPDREFAHRKIRVIEDLITNLRSTQRGAISAALERVQQGMDCLGGDTCDHCCAVRDLRSLLQ